MSELLPCPFCGGENVGTSYKDTFSGDFRRGVYCADCCGGIYPYYDTEAEAVELWNTRYEMTCENAYEYRDSNGVLHRDARIFKCSECGFKADDFYGDDEQSFPRYCPNCGRKVIA